MVRIYNGGDRKGLAADVGRSLRGKGFRVTLTTNTVEKVQKTVIVGSDANDPEVLFVKTFFKSADGPRRQACRSHRRRAGRQQVRRLQQGREVHLHGEHRHGLPALARACPPRPAWATEPVASVAGAVRTRRPSGRSHSEPSRSEPSRSGLRASDPHAPERACNRRALSGRTSRQAASRPPRPSALSRASVTSRCADGVTMSSSSPTLIRSCARRGRTAGRHG